MGAPVDYNDSFESKLSNNIGSLPVYGPEHSDIPYPFLKYMLSDKK